jgi:hypothetical protein
MTEIDALTSAVLRRLAGNVPKAETDRGLDRMASRIVERLAGSGVAAAAIEAFAEQVAVAVGRHLSSRANLPSETTDVRKALQDVDDEDAAARSSSASRMDGSQSP